MFFASELRTLFVISLLSMLLLCNHCHSVLPAVHVESSGRTFFGKSETRRVGEFKDGRE